MRRWARGLLWIISGGLALLTLGAGASLLSNLNLPSHSAVTERLSHLEKAYLAEVVHLRRTLGDKVWPEWGSKDIPIIVYNEKNVFLVGYPDPPAGWFKVPEYAQCGGRWNAVSGDDFFGKTYYSQSSPDGCSPQAFTVVVGERWVASMPTREYARIRLFTDIRNASPAFVRNVVPYRLMWRVLMGETEMYLVGLEHESFHSLQGMMASSRLMESERAEHQVGAKYPWNDARLNAAWKEEMASLVKAVRAASQQDARELAAQFLQQRKARRRNPSLTKELVDYERQREWLEGLAKYAEVSIGRIAAEDSGYQPQQALRADPDFRNYATRERYWSAQLAETTRLAGHSDEVRFYYSGMAEAILLDRLLPGWKDCLLSGGLSQEDLLEEAVKAE